MKFKEYIKEDEVIVVDFQKSPESVLNKIIKKHKAKVTDWFEISRNISCLDLKII